MQSQRFLTDEVKKRLTESGLELHLPDNFYRITPPGNYPPIHPDFEESPFLIGLVNHNNKIMITISMTSYPKLIGKINKYLIATVDMNHISKKALAAQIDVRLGKMSLVGPNNIKKLNADRGYLYNIKVQGKYLGIYPRCKKLEIYKDNVARVEILFFYNYGQDEIVMKEIGKTWGMLKFK